MCIVSYEMMAVCVCAQCIVRNVAISSAYVIWWIYEI